MLDNIKRVKCPPKREFYRDFVYKQQPVVLTNLFEGQPIRQMDSLDRAERTLGDMEVVVQEGHEEYFSRVLKTMTGSGEFSQAGTHRSTVKGYLDLVKREPNTRLICAEVPDSMIGKVEAAYTRPDYCEEDDFRTMLWLGNAGNHTHLHYDGDYRHVMQYQLWGKKRVVLLPAEAAEKIGAIRNNSVLSPEGMTPEESDRFIEYCGGWQTVIGTGETIFMPAAMWHYFEYIDTSMSLTMRFSRNEYTAMLADNCHMDYRLQVLVTRLIDESHIDSTAKKAFEEIRELLIRPMENPMERGQLMQEVYNRLYHELRGAQSQGTLMRPFVNDLCDYVRKLDIFSNALYSGELRTIID